MAFDPIPTTETHIQVTISGRTYRAVRVVERSAGTLLSPVLAATAAIIGQLFPTTAAFERLRVSYNPTSGKETTIVEGSVTSTVVPPPVPYDINSIDGESILSQDVLLIVPASIFGKEATAVAYEMQLR